MVAWWPAQRPGPLDPGWALTDYWCPAGQIAQRLAGCIHLVVVTSGREGQQLGQISPEPGRLEAGGLRQEARLLAKARPLQNGMEIVRAAQILRKRTTT